MRSEQMTNEADQESIRATIDDDGLLVVCWCPCDVTGHATDFGWIEIARRDEDGEIEYADGVSGETWTDARTQTVNDLLRFIA